MSFLEKPLKLLADQQVKRPIAFMAIAALFTVMMLAALPNIRLEGDIMAQMPQDLEPFKNQDKITAKFGGMDTVLVVFYIDPDKTSTSSVRDIRDPRVLSTLIELEELFEEESSVSSISSAASVFSETGVPPDLAGVKAILEQFPSANAFFSEDLTTTVMYISVDVGTATEKINALTRALEEDVSRVSKPSGVSVEVTGSPQIIAAMIGLLEEDALFTVLIAIFLISTFLVIIFRGRGALTILPIVLAATWMYGTMAWLDIPLSIATAGVGAMILGLSVEYDVFYVERFTEEVAKHEGDLDGGLRSALPKVGVSIIGSSMTTISGFLALTLATMPMLQNLGFTLALGIFYSVIVDIVFNPVNVLMVNKFQKYRTDKKIKRRGELCK